MLGSFSSILSPAIGEIAIIITAMISYNLKYVMMTIYSSKNVVIANERSVEKKYNKASGPWRSLYKVFLEIAVENSVLTLMLLLLCMSVIPF